MKNFLTLLLGAIGTAAILTAIYIFFFKEYEFLKSCIGTSYSSWGQTFMGCAVNLLGWLIIGFILLVMVFFIYKLIK